MREVTLKAEISEKKNRSCFNSPNWGKFWIYFGGVSEILQGGGNYGAQCIAAFSAFIAPFATLPPVPFLGAPVPAVVGGTIIAVHATIGSSISHMILNWVTAMRQELLKNGVKVRGDELINKITKEIGKNPNELFFRTLVQEIEKTTSTRYQFTFEIKVKKNPTIASNPQADRSDSSGDEGLVYLPAAASNKAFGKETERLVAKPQKKASRCCFGWRCGCSDLKAYQVLLSSGDVIAHTLDASTVVFIIWTSYKYINGSDSIFWNAIWTLISFIFGVPSSIAYITTCQDAWREYNQLRPLWLALKNVEAGEQAADTAEASETSLNNSNNN